MAPRNNTCHIYIYTYYGLKTYEDGSMSIRPGFLPVGTPWHVLIGACFPPPAFLISPVC